VHEGELLVTYWSFAVRALVDWNLLLHGILGRGREGRGDGITRGR
jgi:hypothetical protein